MRRVLPLERAQPGLDVGLAAGVARRGNGAGYYAGTVDEFAFLAKPLTPLDVLGLYRAGTGS